MMRSMPTRRTRLTMRIWTRQRRLRKLKQWQKCSGPLEEVCPMLQQIQDAVTSCGCHMMSPSQ